MFFCGEELIKYKGDFYHYSAFDHNYVINEDWETYQTHNYMGSEYGEPTTKEERELQKLEDKRDKLMEKIKSLSIK